MQLRHLIQLLFVCIALMFSSCSHHNIQSDQENPNVFPEQSGFVDAHGTLVHYSIVGRGKPLVILFGGPGTSRDYYLPYLLSLARTHRLIFIDRRGSRQSEQLKKSSENSAKTMATDVEAVRIALGLGKIDLLGHSSGGILALAYAVKYQDNLQHLVLCSTAHSTDMMGTIFHAMKGEVPTDYRNLPSFDSSTVINGLNVPTLITAGEQEECDLKLADMMHTVIQGSRLMVFPKTQHMTFMDDPDLFTRTVNQFLQ